jgi:hypothetical protein
MRRTGALPRQWLDAPHITGAVTILLNFANEYGEFPTIINGETRQNLKQPL